MPDDDPAEQLELLPAPRRRQPTPKPAAQAAATNPVARVLVDTGLPHLDRTFDYLVPDDLDHKVVAGCRVKVRFAGKLADGFVVERVDESGHAGRLSFLAKVVSAEPVLSAEVFGLAQAVAARYAGTCFDVVRLAIPPRHATTERRTSQAVSTDSTADPASWSDYPTGPQFVETLAQGSSPRVAWSALPTPDPATLVAQAALATLNSGRGAIVCVPDARDLARWESAFRGVLGDSFVVLTAAQEPADRYAAFLAVERGAVQVVLGTRAAVFAPVHRLGLVACWDDGDDLFSEPRSPYPHTREVMLLRAERENAAILLASFARTAEVQSLVESGWCGEIVPTLESRRAVWPRVVVTDGADTGGVPVRLPRQVFDHVRKADGPVLVQVPRRGYRAALACQTCRTRAQCIDCEGPLLQHAAGSAPQCRWCGTVADPWVCRACQSTVLRAPVVGQLRTAEEIARAFPDHQVVTSGGDSVLEQAPAGRTIVLATPGAEPPVDSGYRVVVLLDTWLMLGRDDIRVLEEAHRRWFNALALAAPGATAVVVGDSAVLQALVRTDPVGRATRELEERRATRMPPVGRLATVEGPPDVIGELAESEWTENTDVLGPVPIQTRGEAAQRLVLRAPRREGAALAAALTQVAAKRSAAKQPGVRIQVDPLVF